MMLKSSTSWKHCSWTFPCVSAGVLCSFASEHKPEVQAGLIALVPALIPLLLERSGWSGWSVRNCRGHWSCQKSAASHPNPALSFPVLMSVDTDLGRQKVDIPAVSSSQQSHINETIWSDSSQINAACVRWQFSWISETHQSKYNFQPAATSCYCVIQRQTQWQRKTHNKLMRRQKPVNSHTLKHKDIRHLRPVGDTPAGLRL